MLKSSIKFLLHNSCTCFAVTVLFFGLASLVDVIARLGLWDTPGIRSSVSSRTGHVENMTEMQNSHKILIREPEVKNIWKN
jgi:hypothetical protein